MLGLGVFIGIAKKAYTQFDSLFGALKARSTYYENDGKSRSDVSRISSAGILDKATILLTPTATSDARVHSVKTYTGDEIVDDSNFSLTGTQAESTTGTYWITGAGWTISGGVANFNTTANSSLKQNLNITSGKTYRIQISGVITSGGLKLTGGSGLGDDTSFSLPLDTIYTHDGGSDRIEIRTIGASVGSIYSVSVVDVSSDFDFDRASSATRINSSGLVQDMQSITDPELVLNGDFEELGDEEVTNGSFDSDSDWSATNGATITGGVLNIDYNLGNGSTTQSNVFTIGKTYKIQLNVDDSSTGTARINSGVPATILSNGLNTFYIEATGTTLEIRNHVNFVGSIDNVSVKQVDPNDRWNLGTGWSIEDGVATCDGSQTTTSSLTQPNTFDTPPQTLSNTYKITFDLVVTNGSLTVSSGSLSQSYTSSGSYTLIGIPATGSGNLNFTAASKFIGTVDNISVKDITFSDDVDLARINYDSNGDNGHILLEPTSTNLLPYSEDFTETLTQSNTVLVTSNQAISPDGTLNADKLIPASGNFQSNGGRYYQFSSTGGTDYSVSIFVKQAEYRYVTFTYGSASAYGFHFDLQDGVILQNIDNAAYTSIGREVESFGNGWYRLKISLTDNSTVSNRFISVRPANATPTATNNNYSTIGDGTSGIYAWGFQLEALSYATSYIPTLTGSTVTREVEKLTGSGHAGLIESRQGTFYVDISALAAYTGAQISISLSGGSSNDRVLIYSGSGGGEWKAQFRKDSSTYVSISKSATISNQAKIAVAWASGRYVMFVDGVKATAYSTGSETESTTFDGGDLTSIQFSPNNGSGTNLFYGKCKALAVFNEALSDTELENLTS